jgi:hypothetical protein
LPIVNFSQLSKTLAKPDIQSGILNDKLINRNFYKSMKQNWAEMFDKLFRLKTLPKMRVILILLLLQMIVTQCSAQNNPQAQSGTTEISNPASNAITINWMDSYSKNFSNLKQYNVLVYPALLSDSYDNVENNGTTMSVVNENLKMIEQTGATGVTIHMGFDPWLIGLPNIITENKTVTKEISDSNKTLMLADASAEYYRHHKQPWDQFETEWINRVTTLAKLFHPAYYTVIKEPPWYVPMIAGLTRDTSSAADKIVSQPTQWISLLSKLIAAVKSVSPNTKVGIAVSGDMYNGTISGKVDSEIMQSAIRLKGLDYIGFDIYTATAFENTAQFLHTYGNGGKSVWITEAWDSTTKNLTNNQLNSETNLKWAQFLIDYARYIRATGVVPFYTNNFASYNPRPSGTQNLLNYYDQRTPLFYEFQKLISTQNNLPNLSNLN